MRRRLISFVILVILLIQGAAEVHSQEGSTRIHLVRPGDTWTALSLRYDLPQTELLAAAGTINPQRQPAIGSRIVIPQKDGEFGRLLRPFAGGTLQTAARYRQSPWAVALQNNIPNPYLPLLYKPIYLSGGLDFPREFPIGFNSLTASPSPAVAGQALLLHALVEPEISPSVALGQNPWLINRNDDHLLALNATGAFFGSGQIDLSIQSEDRPLWTQPWQFNDRKWNFEQLEFTSMPATDPDQMLAERERLQEIWAQNTPRPLWKGSFQWPIQDFVELTSHYGARRSINGGAYATYHEGTDFSAYRGSAVVAPAGGKVVIAEPLIVRGGTVILDHGLGIHSGYYHLSSIAVTQGQMVNAGDLLGEVGSTGRSTGNHLHWDFLIGTTWVDPEAWMDSTLAVQIQNAWGVDFPILNRQDIPHPS